MNENEVKEVEETTEETVNNDLVGKIALIGVGAIIGKLISPVIDKGIKKAKKKAKKAKKKKIKKSEIVEESNRDDFEDSEE